MRDWTNTTTRHGTNSGWTLHTDLRERPCEPCYAAKQAYDKRRRLAPDKTRISRLRAKAQMAAYRDLAHRYPSEYSEAYRRYLVEQGLSVGNSRLLGGVA